MDHGCFIIMPQGEPNGYAQGHFNRVYEYVIVPACRAAGYWPTRADNATYDSPLAVVKDIIDSEIALFDVSANNSNALYGLAIRQALGLPVTLAKDMKSLVMFNAGEFGLVEYDESLRIDTVQKAVEGLSDALKNAMETKKERHELLNRLSIGLPQFAAQSIMVDTNITSNLTASTDEATHQEEENEAAEDRLPIISPLPDYVGDPFSEQQIRKLKTGDVLFHLRHGKGKVNFVKKMGKDELASIQFGSGPKLLVLTASNFFRKINK
jgi:hypothetical protein